MATERKKRKKGSRFVSVRIRFYTKLLFNISFIRDATKTSESNHHQWRFDLQLWRVCCGDELTGNQTNGWINGWTKEGGNELLHRKRIKKQKRDVKVQEKTKAKESRANL